MSIRITKLHIILFMTAVALSVFFFVKQNADFSLSGLLSSVPKISTPSSRSSAVKTMPPPVLEQQAPDPQQLKINANKVIAIAGEEMSMAMKQGKDVSQGQQMLRQAKELYRSEEYVEAESRALDSINAFKQAPVTTVSSYTVKKGDNLWNISKRNDIYGRGAGWVKIWRANEGKIPDFDYIYRGQVLKIPREQN